MFLASSSCVCGVLGKREIRWASAKATIQTGAICEKEEEEGCFVFGRRRRRRVEKEVLYALGQGGGGGGDAVFAMNTRLMGRHAKPKGFHRKYHVQYLGESNSFKYSRMMRENA